MILLGSTVLLASQTMNSVHGFVGSNHLPVTRRSWPSQRGSVGLRSLHEEAYADDRLSKSALQVIRINDSATLPSRATAGSVGYDLCSAQETVIKAGASQLVSTALIVAIPDGFYGRVAPRSGLAVRNSIHVGAGVIDPDYRGELKVLLHNLGADDFVVRPGDRIAQLIVEACATPPVVEVQELEETERGLGGFGSTGTA